MDLETERCLLIYILSMSTLFRQWNIRIYVTVNIFIIPYMMNQCRLDHILKHIIDMLIIALAVRIDIVMSPISKIDSQFTVYKIGSIGNLTIISTQFLF